MINISFDWFVPNFSVLAILFKIFCWRNSTKLFHFGQPQWKMAIGVIFRMFLILTSFIWHSSIVCHSTLSVKFATETRFGEWEVDRDYLESNFWNAFCIMKLKTFPISLIESVTPKHTKPRIHANLTNSILCRCCFVS